MHAVDAEHVRDLVRVGDDGRRPEREHEPRELVDHQLHRLEVHVRVDEPRDDVAPARVERLASLVLRRARRSTPSDDRDVGLEPLAREDREHAPAADDEIGRLVPTGDCEPALERVHEARLIRREPGARRVALAVQRTVL